MIKSLKKIARAALNSPSHFREKLKLMKLEKNEGYCNICESETTFVIYDPWLRDNYKCIKCGTIPRNRALLNAIHKFSPGWEKMQLHESSPGNELSKFLRKKCAGYSSSHYYSDVPRGEYKGLHRSEDLSAMTFPDNSFDLLVTSDVFEHVFEPAKAFAEINRVLKPGGQHIFTMPWIPALKRSECRAKFNPDGTINYLKEAHYHGNPIDAKGSLVTFDWGLDFPDFIYTSSGMTTTIYLEIDRKKGLDGQFLEVFVSRKPDAKE
jgi:SAM-dependent methyltransferase